MASGACVIIVGSIIGATAKHIAQFMVARFILGFGISIMSVSSPAYSMEVSGNSGQYRTKTSDCSSSVAWSLHRHLQLRMVCWGHSICRRDM